MIDKYEEALAHIVKQEEIMNRLVAHGMKIIRRVQELEAENIKHKDIIAKNAVRIRQLASRNDILETKIKEGNYP